MIHRIASIMCILFVFVFVSGCASDEEPSQSKLVTAESEQSLTDLELTADRFYKFAEQDKPEQALAELNVLNRLVPMQTYDGITTLQGMEELTRTIREANETFVAAAYDPKQAMLSAAKVKLAVDALIRDRRPMWMEFDKTIALDVKRVKSAVADQDMGAVEQMIAQTIAHYEMIRPALIITGKSVETGAVDSLISTMKTAVREQSFEHLSQLIEHYSVITKQLFKTDTSTMVLPVDDRDQLVWTLAIGAIVVSVLSYVAWRRYLYERNNVISVKQRQKMLEP